MKELRFLVISAHPDDGDLIFGGTAIRLARQGHHVRLVSVTNGNAGHQSMNPSALAARRYHETQRAAAVAKIEYQVLNHNDGRLEANLETREEIIRLIRNFRPDAVVTHRTCDYHADHRATGQLVQDAAFLIGVPLCCPDTPATERPVVFLLSYDNFTSPRPSRIDAAVPTDDAIETKLDMLMHHESQFFEWLPWINGNRDFDASGWSVAEKRKWIFDNWIAKRDQVRAERGREVLVRCDGEAGRAAKFAELFELSEYGAQPSAAELNRLLRGEV